MNTIKERISRSLEVGLNSLNEIEIEDISFAPIAEQDISKTISKMMTLDEPPPIKPMEEEQIVFQSNGTPFFKGFWVEETKDLVLFVTVGCKSSAIVVPRESWMIRKDITIH